MPAASAGAGARTGRFPGQLRRQTRPACTAPGACSPRSCAPKPATAWPRHCTEGRSPRFRDPQARTRPAARPEARYRKLSEELGPAWRPRLPTRGPPAAASPGRKARLGASWRPAWPTRSTTRWASSDSNLGTFKLYLDKFAALHPRLAEGEAAWYEPRPRLRHRGRRRPARRLQRRLAGSPASSPTRRASSNVGRPRGAGRPQRLPAARGGRRRHAAGAGVRLETALGPCRRSRATRGHLNQVFFSLIRNGMQAIQDAGRPGNVGMQRGRPPPRITIRIRDDGVGMSPPSWPRLRALLPPGGPEPAPGSACPRPQHRARHRGQHRAHQHPGQRHHGNAVLPDHAMTDYKSLSTRRRARRPRRRQPPHAAEIPPAAGGRRGRHRERAAPGVPPGELRDRHRQQRAGRARAARRGAEVAWSSATS